MRLLRNISDRDRRLLVPTVIIAAFISVLLFVDIPLYKTGMEMERKALEEEKRLKSIISMSREYLSEKNEIGDVRERAFKGEGVSLAGVDSIVNRAGLKKRLLSLKPTTVPVADDMKRVRVELSLEKVSLPDIVRLIAALGADGHTMTVEKTSIKASYEDTSLFNATLIVNTVELVK